jgi:hypothetical protein
MDNKINVDLDTLNFTDAEELKAYIREDGEKDKKVLLEKLKFDGLYLKNAYYKLRADKEVVLAAVRENGTVLEYAHPKFRDDKDVVLAAVQSSSMNMDCFDFISKRLKYDKEIVFIAISVCRIPLAYVPEIFREDKYIMSFVLTDDCEMLKYASPVIKDDKDLVLIVVNLNGSYLKYASFRLKDDEEVVRAAIRANGHALKFASERLNLNKKFMLSLIQQCNGNYDEYVLFCSMYNNLRNDEDFITEAFKININILRYASIKLKDDEHFLCYLDQITKITNIQKSETERRSTSKRISIELRKNPDYLTDFLPVYLKPAKK